MKSSLIKPMVTKSIVTKSLVAAVGTCLFLVGGMFALPSSSSEVEKAITNLEYAWAGAQRDGKPDVVQPMLADSFINTDSNGQTSGRAQVLSNLKGGKWEQNGISDVNVTVYGDAAVATGAWRGKGVDGDGAKIDRGERWTDTWVKTSQGQWQCVASQQTATK
jgi:ketosteroid isomerase-like protein